MPDIPPDNYMNFSPVCFLRPHSTRTGLWLGEAEDGTAFIIHRSVDEKDTFILRRMNFKLSDLEKK